MKKNKFALSKLFRNDKFLIVFAFVCSCILWFIFSQNSNEDTITTITDVPITVRLSQDATDDGMRVFSKSTDKASVSISGNKITVGSIKPDDILITATQTGAISSMSSYALELKAEKNSSKTNYSILSVDPSFVNVYIDKYSEEQFKITDEIKDDYTLDETYYAGSHVYSTDTISISGPETEVLKVSKVALEGEIKGQLKETVTIDADVVLYGDRGERISSDLIDVSADKVTVTVNVMPKKEVPIKPQFVNMPSDFDVEGRVTVEPSSIVVAGSETALTTLPFVNLPEIDFADIDPTKNDEFEMDVQLPSGCRNISNITKAKVKIDFSGYDKKQFTVTDFNFKNVGKGSSAVATTTDLTVAIAGPQEVLEALEDSDITATVDLTDKGDAFAGAAEVPVTITVNGKKDCWSFGSYTVNVTVEKTEET